MNKGEKQILGQDWPLEPKIVLLYMLNSESPLEIKKASQAINFTTSMVESALFFLRAREFVSYNPRIGQATLKVTKSQELIDCFGANL